MHGRIRDSDLVKELVREAAPLEQIAESYGIELQQSGPDRLKGICPFHPDTDPSLAISLSRQVYYCYGCHEGGDVFDLVQRMESVSFVSAVRYLAGEVGFDLSPYEAEPTKEERERELLYSAFAQLHSHTQEGKKKAAFQKWAEERLLSLDVLDRYGVGYLSSLPKVEAKGKHKKALLISGSSSQDKRRWEKVVTMPLRDDFGRVTAYRNRYLDKGDGPKVRGPLEKHPLPVPPVYGFYEARKGLRRGTEPFVRPGTIILVEGEVDVWQMVSAGYETTCATYGTYLDEDMLSFLAERGVREVILMPDGDKGGREFARRVAKSRFKAPVAIRIATLHDGDPDEVLLRDPGEVEAALLSAKYKIHYLLDDAMQRSDLSDMTGKIEFLQDVKDDLASATTVEQDLAVKYLAEELGLDPVSIGDFLREEVEEKEKLHDVQGERVVLARCLKDEEFAGEVVLHLMPVDFWLDRHKAIYGAVAGLYRSRQAVSKDTVRVKLQQMGAEIAAGYLDSLEQYDDTESSRYLLQDLRDKAVRRQVKRVAGQVVQSVGDPTQPAQTIVQGFMADVAKIIVGSGDELHDADALVQRRMALMHERMKNPALITGLDLGPDFDTINKTLHGLQGSRYTVVAAPTGIGKSSLIICWLARITVQLDEPALLLTFETGKEAMTDRMISHMSGVEGDQLVTGFLTEEEADLVHDAGEVIASSPLIITERGRTWEDAQAIIRHDVLRRGTKFIGLDYIQLMEMADARGIARHQELGRISRGLLEISHELGVHLVAVAQINREGAKRGRSAQTDIGESFKIPQDADTFIIMDEKTEEEQQLDGAGGGNRFLFISKNRFGKDKVGVSAQADLAVCRVWEVKARAD